MLSFLFGIMGFSAAFAFVLFNHAEKFSGFYDKSAMFLLVVAPISVMFISHGFMDFFRGVKTLFSMAFFNQAKEMTNIANMLTQFSSAIRMEGMGVLAQGKNQVKNQLFREGITLILNSFTAEEIRHNLIAKINTRQNQYSHSANLFESLGKLCPGMGLVGTIIGLVQMLSNLTDPTKIGAGMAVSLLATLYGLILGTVIYTPMSEKITMYAEKTLQLDTMIMEGVLLLKEKKSHAHVRDVVNTYSHGKNSNQQPDPQGGQGGAPRSQAPQGRGVG
jgi:chemotaxis protein MotA